MALPAGAVAVEAWAGADLRRWRQAVGGVVANGLVLLPAVAPVTPVRKPPTSTTTTWTGRSASRSAGPTWSAYVAAIYEVLPADEKADVRIVTAGRGRRAPSTLRPSRGLPRGTALSPRVAGRWPDGEPAGTVIFLDYRAGLEPYCDAMGPIAVVG